MTAHAFRRGLLTIVCAGVAALAAAQDAPNSERATDLGLIVGASSAEQAGTMVAGTAGFRVAPWAALEGRGTWFAGEPGSDTFAADLGLVTHLPWRGRLAPYVGGAFGLYQTRAQRGGVTVTDPAYRLTGGVEFVARRNFVLRPEASLLVVHGQERSTMLLLGVQFGYRFEDHPVTPARRAR